MANTLPLPCPLSPSLFPGIVVFVLFFGNTITAMFHKSSSTLCIVDKPLSVCQAQLDDGRRIELHGKTHIVAEIFVETSS